MRGNPLMRALTLRIVRALQVESEDPSMREIQEAANAALEVWYSAPGEEERAIRDRLAWLDGEDAKHPLWGWKRYERSNLRAIEGSLV